MPWTVSASAATNDGGSLCQLQNLTVALLPRMTSEASSLDWVPWEARTLRFAARNFFGRNTACKGMKEAGLGRGESGTAMQLQRLPSVPQEALEMS